MTRVSPLYLLGVAGWLLAWAAAFAVSALATRRHLHGTQAGDRLLLTRDLLATAVAACAWRALQPTDAGAMPVVFNAALSALALALTAVYLILVARYGVRRVATPHTYMQRHPIIPLRILSFVLFQQLAVTFFLLDWHRIYFTPTWALVLTALIFSVTHLGVVLYGLPLLQGVLLTLGSGAAMLLWGTLRIEYRSACAGLLTHYLFYIGLACHHAWNNGTNRRHGP